MVEVGKKYALYDVLTLKARYEEGWSKWQSKSGALYVFKHLPVAEKAHSPIAQCYKDRRYFSGVFKTKNPLEFSGDIKDGKKRTFLLFNFEDKDKVKILKQIS